MNAEIISVGDEIIKGYVMGTNASYISRQLQTIGIVPDYHTGVREDIEAIKSAIRTAINRSKYIIITGDLGLRDDLTQYFKEINKERPPVNEKQVTFSKGAITLKNLHGIASGCIVECNEATMVLLPVPQSEMEPMLDHEVLPYLRQRQTFYSETLDIKLFGLSESEVATHLKSLLGEFEWGSIVTYVEEYEIIVSITVSANEKAYAKQQLLKKKKEVEACLGGFVIGYNKDRLEENVAKFLLDHKKTVATVESCTGGLLAGTLINCSGISDAFNEGIVTYSNAAKMKYVGVKEETLQAVGAVSKQTAKEMAEGIRKCSGADIGLSTTGIAGPGGGTPEKPVGLVYIGIATPEKTEVYELHLKGTRKEIREKTVKNILFQLYQLFKQNSLAI